jgi:hypothetical protein
MADFTESSLYDFGHKYKRTALHILQGGSLLFPGSLRA